jgi:hypothetical protein
MAEERYSIRRSLAEILAAVGGEPVLDLQETAGLTAARIVEVLEGGSGEVPDWMSLVPLGNWLARMTAHFGGAPTTEDAVGAANELLRALRGDPGGDVSSEERYLGDILKDVLDALPPAPEPSTAVQVQKRSKHHA